jgi:hypothetical protein
MPVQLSNIEFKINEPTIISIFPDIRSIIYKESVSKLSLSKKKHIETYDPFVKRERPRSPVEPDELKKRMKQWMKETNQI